MWYIGTPHTFHKEQSIACLNNNKHVLCEKPVTVNKAELESILNVAKSKKEIFHGSHVDEILPSNY